MDPFEVASRRFQEMGGCLRPEEHPARRIWESRGNRMIPDPRPDYELDVEGATFHLRYRVRRPTRFEVLDARPAERHLLLLVQGAPKETPARFLCGHDERHWFAAALPATSRATTVTQGIEDLKPSAVAGVERAANLSVRERRRRHNAVRSRQGEWFFVPRPGREFDSRLILHWEPLRRGSGKPHLAEECVRFSGRLVYLHRDFPEGIPEEEFRAVLARGEPRHRSGWQTGRAFPRTFVRGRIRHPDHKTVVLKGWHRVYTNTEHLSAARRNLVFVD